MRHFPSTASTLPFHCLSLCFQCRSPLDRRPTASPHCRCPLGRYYESNGLLVIEQWNIIRNYAKTWLIIDVVRHQRDGPTPHCSTCVLISLVALASCMKDDVVRHQRDGPTLHARPACSSLWRRAQASCLPVTYIALIADGLDSAGEGEGEQLKAIKILRMLRLAKMLRVLRVKRLLARCEPRSSRGSAFPCRSAAICQRLMPLCVVVL